MAQTNDSNIHFSDLIYILKFLGFDERIKGSHHIFSKTGVIEIINLQSKENNKSKTYQVKQVRNILLKYKLVELENV
ncbi:MAG: type II toxin-antitoxin system HicA family toxin [Candidatus Kapabacteria bacterium]|nr:type II toxin-antitoxin system HicA family toxin [Candidatus Kapabacteria bacterium]